MEPNDFFESNPHDDPQPESGSPRSLLKLALWSIIAGGAVGVAVGGVINAFGPGAETAQEEQLVAAEAVVFQPEPAPVAGSELLAAQQQVLSLEEELAAAEGQLAEVRRAAGLTEEQVDPAELVAKVEHLRQNLDAARRVRDDLKGQLKEALAAVEVSDARADRAAAKATAWRTESVRSQWETFKARTKTELCDHGTRTAVDRCQASLDAYFTDARYSRFAACVEGGGAAPVLLSTPRGETVPEVAEAIKTPAIRQKKDWFVLYCDPNLPERADNEWPSPRVASLE